MALKLDFSKLDKKQRRILGILGAAVVIAGFYMLYYDPSKKEMVTLRKEITAKDKEIKTMLLKAPLAKKLEREIAELEKQLNIFRVKIATSGEIIPLVKTIEDEAQRLDLKVINMSTSVHEPPPPPPPEEGTTEPEVQAPRYTMTNLDIDIQGDFDKLEDFIRTLHNLETFVIIEKLDIISDEDMYPRMATNVVIDVFTKKD